MKYKYEPNNELPYIIELSKEEAMYFRKMLFSINKDPRYKILKDQFLDAINPNTPGR